MKTFKYLEVFYHDQKVGTLAYTREGKIAFEYDKDWLLNGFSISPLSLPLEKKVFIPKSMVFDGLFGVFNDSLPDGWGRLLVDRMLIKHQIDPHSIGALERLAIVGNSGMGALEYHPYYEFNTNQSTYDLDLLAEECSRILNSEKSDELDTLFRLGGSSGGARPKIINDEWIIKFSSSQDSPSIGIEEYRYSQCAKLCGIHIPETQLFPSKKCSGYFGIKRFDRETNESRRMNKVHMISASGLLETTHRIPNLDYNILMKLTSFVTKSYEEIEKLYRLMCFNVFAHNRDDHSKNFSYLYDEEKGWVLSPAYDLTYSHSLGGEHATAVNGNGKNPCLDDLLAIAENIGLNKTKAKKIALEIQAIVQKELKDILEEKS